MASYLQKLRPKSKQNDPVNFRETVVHNAPKTEEPAKPSGSVPSPPPAPTISEPAEETGAEPVLDEEDEKFLERLAAIASEPEGTPPPLPGRPAVVIDSQGQQKVGKDAQEALMDGADKVALPKSPPEKKAFSSYFSLPKFGSKKTTDKDQDTPSSTKDKKGKAKVTSAERNELADNLLLAAERTKSAEEAAEIEAETRDLTKILDDLNMSAVNNRVFSFSKESEELLQKFTLVLKDIVNGAPTAYNDLEKLFTDYDAQLKKMYGGLPPFLQNFVKSLPAKMTAALGPELLAASAEKPGFDGKQRAGGGGGGSKSKKSRIPGVPKIPSLKQLVSAQGAVATALRSIVNFLKFRFPALATGTNLIMSLAVMILLFVFWYCHKRGREVRLEKERLAAESASAEASGASSAVASDADDDSVFGDRKRQKTAATASSASVPPVEGEPREPLIIKDDKEEGKATVADLPDVSSLPEPGAVGKK